MSSEPLRVLLEVASILDGLGVAYAVGGSVASSVFGEPRTSADVDLIAALSPAHARALQEAMDGRFYVSDEAIGDAVRRSSSFNAIHLDTMLKVDVFVAGDSVLDREQLARRRTIVVASGPERTLCVTAPENIVLRKLDRYRIGGGVADQQWRDVLGVLKAQAEVLDRDYLERVARTVGLTELYVRALADAGV